MNAFTRTLKIAAVAALCPWLACAQPGWPYAPPIGGGVTTPDAQRNAMNSVSSQVNWLQNATRTAANYGDGGYGVLWQQFQGLRAAYNAFKGTLTPQQLNYGANEVAELAAGLDIIQEAFSNYQEDVAAGQPAQSASANMTQVLGQGAAVWLQEFNRDCARLRVGW